MPYLCDKGGQSTSNADFDELEASREAAKSPKTWPERGTTIAALTNRHGTRTRSGPVISFTTEPADGLNKWPMLWTNILAAISNVANSITGADVAGRGKSYWSAWDADCIRSDNGRIHLRDAMATGRRHVNSGAGTGTGTSKHFTVVCATSSSE